MDAPPPVVVQIQHEGQEYTWHVAQPQLLTYANVMDYLATLLHPGFPTAFEYEDEDGDRITVRTEQEAEHMLFTYMTQLLEAVQAGETAAPLSIFPRASKPAEKRNVEKLKIETAPGGAGMFGAAGNVGASGGSEGEFVASMSADIVADSCFIPSTEAQDMSGSLDEEAAAPGTVQEGATPDITGIMGRVRHADLEPMEVLGTGAGGTVYRVIHKPTQEILAMKEMPVDVSEFEQRRIVRELEIIKQCQSPYIIQFFDAYFIDTKIVFCSEYMDGGSLERYGQIPEHILGRIVVSVVKGLYYLCGLHIMHRDVKPSNMLVNRQGSVKLCDFGVSTQLAETMANVKTSVGTCLYMAPERIRAQEYNIHSDVWSLGISIFEMATGKHPYDELRYLASSSPFPFMQEVLKRTPPQLPEGFCGEMRHFVSQCMRIEVTERAGLSSILHHEFIKQFDDGRAHVIADWVTSRLAQPRPVS